MSDSRPKKTSASSSQNANRPLYGHRGMSHPGFVSDDRTLLSGRVTADAMHSVVGPPSAAATCSCTPSWQEFRTASRLAMEAGLSRTVGEAVRSVSVAFAGEGFCCSEPVEPESCGCGGALFVCESQC